MHLTIHVVFPNGIVCYLVLPDLLRMRCVLLVQAALQGVRLTREFFQSRTPTTERLTT